MPTIKNIIIFISIGIVIVLIYIFFFKPGAEVPSLVSSTTTTTATTATTDTVIVNNNEMVAKDFLTLLLSVKSIKLDDTIFSDNAFISLRDSSITLTPDGTEGRINPFAPLGADTGTSANSL